MSSTKAELVADRPAGAPWALADARDYLGVSERTFRRLTSSGRVRTIRIGGKPMVPDAEVRRLAAEGC